MATNETLTYKGNCHCGRYRFEVDTPEITSAISCDCGMCAKKGYLWLVPNADAFRVVRDDNRLTEFTSASLRDKFCNFCGTGVVGEHVNGSMSGQFAVNIRALHDVNPYQLESNIVKKTANEPKRDQDALAKMHAPGPPPEGATVHEAAQCYCGKVRAELLFPLSEAEIKEDNCSICARIAYIGVYPTRDKVRLFGRENTFEYLDRRKYGGNAHCKDCGVFVFNFIYGPDPSVYDDYPPDKKEAALQMYHRNMALQPINVRSIEGVDPDSLKIARLDEGPVGYTLED